MKRSIGLVLAILIFLPLLYVVVGLWQIGYRSLSEMDWDGDGSTSLSEILTALDVVKVPSRERPNCIEYLDAKSGSHVYAVRCNAG